MTTLESFMRLAQFITTNMEPILAEWEAYARSLLPGEDLTILELRNDAESILRFIAQDMQVHQSLQEQSSKSKGHGGAGGPESDSLNHSAMVHGTGRMISGFDITEVVAEYRTLRASVLRLWAESLPTSDLNDPYDIQRFNEALDQSLAGAVQSCNERIEQSRRMFLAILCHDLRNPLACIRMATDRISRSECDSDSIQAAETIDASTEVAIRLISDLTDYTSTTLGRPIGLNRVEINLTALCREVIAAYQTTHPGRTLLFHSGGDITGIWDAVRVRQVIWNLVDNALQHGSPEGAVELSVALEASEPDESTVVLSVHNDGPPIPADALRTIFDPLKRYVKPTAAASRRPGSIGLGLFIVREIVVAKGGTVHVVSTAEEGTTFTVRLPRIDPVESEELDDAKATA